MQVAVFGDSLVSSSFAYIAWFLGMRGDSTLNKTWGGTAPCDWFNEASTVSCDYAIVSFSGNMITPCTKNRGTQAQVYAADMGKLGDIFAFRGIPVLWCSPPGAVGTLESANTFISVNQAPAIKWKNAGQRFDNSAEVLTIGTGGARYYEKWMPSEYSDIVAGYNYLGVALVREDDGRHLRPSGQRRWAERIVRNVWR